MDFSIIKKLNLANKMKPSKDKLFGANGLEILILGTINLLVIIEDKSFKWDFTITRNMVHKIIIGMDIIRNHFENISVSRDGKFCLNNLNKKSVYDQYPSLFKFKQK